MRYPAMTPKARRLCLTSLSLLLLVAAVGFVAWAQFQPLPTLEISATSALPPSNVLPNATPHQPRVHPDNPCWQMALSAQVVEPTEFQPPRTEDVDPIDVEPIVQRNLEFRLMGIVLEGGKSQAIVSDANRQIDIRGRGESLELHPQGAIVKSISDDSILISFDGIDHALMLEE